MSPARIDDNLACRSASRHTISLDSHSMAGSGLYYRPVICKFCDKVFDFPTLTTDINEKDVPVKTRICSRCLWEMGHDEGLRERRANAEAAIQHSYSTLSEKILPIVNGHKSSLSSVATNDTSSTDVDFIFHSNETPDQAYNGMHRSSQAPTETRASSEPRQMPSVRSILN